MYPSKPKISKSAKQSIQNSSLTRFFKQYTKEPKKLLLLLLVVTPLVILLLFVWVKKSREPMFSYEDYLKMSQDVVDMDTYATSSSKAWQSQKEQMDEEAYQALILGLPVDESSIYYETQKKTFGSAKNEAEVAVGAVIEHEAAIRDRGGVVDYADLVKLDTGNILDPHIRETFEQTLGGKTSHADFVDNVDNLENQTGDQETAFEGSLAVSDDR